LEWSLGWFQNQIAGFFNGADTNALLVFLKIELITGEEIPGKFLGFPNPGTTSELVPRTDALSLFKQ
jgi:hypothetical protein